ncbi:MAG: amidase family protein [Beijerinckiaceae bacterium]
MISQVAGPGIFVALREKDAIFADCRKLGPFDPEQKLLWGVPLAVKDNIDVAAMTTTVACPEFACVIMESATAIERLIAAGRS